MENISERPKRSNIDIDKFITQCSIENILRSRDAECIKPLTQEEILKNTLESGSYNQQKIRLFVHYQNKTMPPEALEIYKGFIAKMCRFLKSKGLYVI